MLVSIGSLVVILVDIVSEHQSFSHKLGVIIRLHEFISCAFFLASVEGVLLIVTPPFVLSAAGRYVTLISDSLPIILSLGRGAGSVRAVLFSPNV